MLQLGDRIRIKRELLSLSQDELAQKLGYKSRSSINKIEKNLTDIPQSKVVEFARALDTTVAYLMGWEESPSNTKEEIEIDTIAAHALRDLTEDEQQKIIEFAKFIKSQRVDKK